jgi:hypothetical protein
MWPLSSHVPNILDLTLAREISARNLSGSKGCCKADNLTAICESIVQKMWEPRRHTTLWASKACYRDSFSFIYTVRKHVMVRNILQVVIRALK